MNKLKTLYRILLLLSIVFLVIYFIRFDFLSFNNLKISPIWLAVSVVLVYLGFFLSATSWMWVLKLHHISISQRQSVISHGLSIFAKYIPGKVWVILGRAAYVANKQKIGVSKISFYSLKEQLLFILVGLLISIVPFWMFFEQFQWRLILVATIVLLVCLLYIKPVHIWGEQIISRILKRKIVLPLLTIKESLPLGAIILLYWMFWTIGFYALIRGLSININLFASFAFPLSACFGILAIIFPGGIGVREGIMVVFLTTVGLTGQEAVTISVISRLWFILGEILIFSTAVILSFLEKRTASKI